MSEVPVACTIAGSDSGAGAGIQADIKTFSALGVYGASVVVALTAQNTVGVRGVQVASPDMVAAQIDAVAEDLAPIAWKTGMLANADVINIVVDRLQGLGARNLVVDPVMVAKSGDSLLDDTGVTALADRLLPMAMVLTPNMAEAAELTATRVESLDDARRAAAALAWRGPKVVVVKGGHAPGDSVVDVVYEQSTGQYTELTNPRVPGNSTHGTGCTLSAAIAGYLARGLEPLPAITAARAYLQQALIWAPGLGSGHGPLGHAGPPGHMPVREGLRAAQPGSEEQAAE